MWMTVDSTTAKYPTDGQGGASRTLSASLFASAVRGVCIEGYRLETDGATDELEIVDRSGTLIEQFRKPAVTELLGIEPGGGLGRRDAGFFIPDGFGARLYDDETSADAVYTVFFRIVD